jgi:hypothetical protein
MANDIIFRLVQNSNRTPAQPAKPTTTSATSTTDLSPFEQVLQKQLAQVPTQMSPAANLPQEEGEPGLEMEEDDD